MAAIKRKAVFEERLSKKSKSAKSSEAARPAKAQEEQLSERRAVPKSILQQEERAFPRGGASALTPIEHKQIKAQAERDVLFEQQTGRPVAPGEAEHFEHEHEHEHEHEPAATKKTHKKHRETKDTNQKPDTPSIKIQGLSYKNLVIGSVVLGCITAITSRDVALALANNLTGYIPITAISGILNRRIENLLDDEGQHGAGDDDEDVDLKKLFFVGQWLRATVVSTGSEALDSAGKSKRHIELTADPSRVNGGLSPDHLVLHSMVQASVRSVEDHGIVMDVGLLDSAVRGFIGKKELGAAFTVKNLEEGQVMMCMVVGKGSGGKVLKLTPDPTRFSVFSSGKDVPIVSEAPTVECFQPGTAVDFLVTESGAGGVTGKVMGMLDVTADIVHCGLGRPEGDVATQYKIGSKAKARIIWTLPGDDGSRRIGLSLLNHNLALPPPSSRLPPNPSEKFKSQAATLETQLPLSAIVEEATVKSVLSDRGLTMSFMLDSGKLAMAYAHISQLSDSQIDSLSSTTGPYKIGTTHRARIMSYNPVDSLYYVSLKKSTLDQAFLRIEDLTVGQAVKGTVDKLILGAKGIIGVLVKLSDSITALVPEMHLSDAQLQHPERKFKEGFPVKGRILSVDLERRHVRLTLKKTLVNSDEAVPIWKDYGDLQPDMTTKGTIINLLANGAVVQFFGNVRAWLPVAEMSDTFIEHPETHFRLGQTVTVRIVSVDPQSQEMKVSCKDQAEFGTSLQEAWGQVSTGDLVSGTVTEKSNDSVTVELANGLKGLVRVGHLTDGPPNKFESALKKTHVAQAFSQLLVVDKLERSHRLLLSKKPSMVEAAKTGSLLCSFEDVHEASIVHGFVRNVTSEGVYVEFVSGLVGFMPKTQVEPELLTLPEFGFVKDRTLTASVLRIDDAKRRFTLSMREQTDMHEQKDKTAAPQKLTAVPTTVSNAIDPMITSLADFALGKVLKARISTVKATQLNVRLADNIQGRVDVSEVFDSWDEIIYKKAPLQTFKQDEVVEVKILGIHDARSHRFLPITHRQSSVTVFELSAKRSRIQSGNEFRLTMDSVKAGETCLAFVNNHGDNCVWVNLSPNVRGRIALMDLSDDPGQLQNLNKGFPIGCAIRATVKLVNPAENRLDLTVRVGSSEGPLTLRGVSTGMILPGRVTKVTERSVIVQLSESLSAPVPLVDLSDDFDELNLHQYSKNDIVRVSVPVVDLPNKKIFLSLRPSKVLSSGLPVKDAQITSYAQLKPGAIIRGFVKHVADKVVYVSLGPRIDAIVRIADLSDHYIKDWKSIVEIDQLVKGRLISVDVAAKTAFLSLKASQVDENYISPVTIHDLKVDMIVTGKVRKVEDFGAFIDLDNTQPRLSGLCHRSEMASKRVPDATALYSPGDVVKAKILKIDVEAKKISLGLKASYFANMDVDDIDEDLELDDEDNEAEFKGVDVGADDDLEIGSALELPNIQEVQSSSGDSDDEDQMNVDEVIPSPSTGLKTGGFDWSGSAFEQITNGDTSDSEPDTSTSKKRRRHKPEIKVDLTGDLDKYGPRNTSDFERQLLGQPDNSSLWVQYMAFQLQLSEIQKARDIAERALRTMPIDKIDEKENVWVAWLNLEVEYGEDEQVEDVFKRACQVQDPLEMHKKFASIYIDSRKHDKADAVFERMVGNKNFRARPEVWLNYADFLMDKRKEPAKARLLLLRALQSIPNDEERLLTANYAALEFHSLQGDPERGRTVFENLLSEWPKWSSGWDMWVDLERARIAHGRNEEDQQVAKEKTRALYERMAAQKLKPRRAKFIFKRWLEFEEAEGSTKTIERVKALAKEYVQAQQAKGGDDEMEH